MFGLNAFWLSLVGAVAVSLLTVVWLLRDEVKKRKQYDVQMEEYRIERKARREAEARDAARKEAERAARIAAGLPPEPEADELEDESEAATVSEQTSDI